MRKKNEYPPCRLMRPLGLQGVHRLFGVARHLRGKHTGMVSTN